MSGGGGGEGGGGKHCHMSTNVTKHNVARSHHIYMLKNYILFHKIIDKLATDRKVVVMYRATQHLRIFMWSALHTHI